MNTQTSPGALPKSINSFSEMTTGSAIEGSLTATRKILVFVLNILDCELWTVIDWVGFNSLSSMVPDVTAGIGVDGVVVASLVA